MLPVMALGKTSLSTKEAPSPAMSRSVYRGPSPAWFYPLDLSIISTIIIFSLQHQAQLPHRLFTVSGTPSRTLAITAPLHPNSTYFNFKMRFFTAATFFLAATAAPVDQSETSASGQIEKRLDPITISVITGVTSAAAGWATTQGLNTLKGLIKDTSSWDKVGVYCLSPADVWETL